MNTKICPVSKYEIIESDKWKKIKVSDKYIVSFKKIGNNIISVHGEGNIQNYDSEEYIKLLEGFIEDQSIEKPYVELRTYEDLVGLIPSKKTLIKQKEYFIKNDHNYAAFIIYNATTLMKMIIKSAKRQYKDYNLRMEICNDYSDAIMKAKEVLNSSSKNKTKEKKKVYKISNADIDNVVLYSGRCLWDSKDNLEYFQQKQNETSPLYPIVENLTIVREELLNLEDELSLKTQDLNSVKIQAEMVVNSLNLPILIVDSNTDEIIKLNEAACNILEDTKENITHRKFNDFISYNLNETQNKTIQKVDLYTKAGNIVAVERSSIKINYNNKPCIIEQLVSVSNTKMNEEKEAFPKQLSGIDFEREKRIIEMKKEVNELLGRLNEKAKYNSVIGVADEKSKFKD